MRALRSLETTTLSEEQFYSRYSWCLNPMLSLRELFQRLREEMDRYDGLPVGWQREESAINLCIFVCAIACTVDDYLAWRPWDLSPIAKRVPRLRWAVVLVEWFLNRPRALRSLAGDRTLVLWRQRWQGCVDRICEMLASESESGVGAWADLRATAQVLTTARLSARVLERRMRLPQGFRCQDLTHHDVFALTRRFAASCLDKKSQLIIIGARTAGAYLAPLVRAYLSVLGWPLVSWLTIRPKIGLSRWERQRLRVLMRRDTRVLLVDDYPETGHTLKLLLGNLKRWGVLPERITIFAPRHPLHPEWTLPEATAQGATIVTLEHAELQRARSLEPDSVEPILQEYYGDRGWEDVRIQESDHVNAINFRLWQHYPDGFHVRLKRVFEVRLGQAHQAPIVKRVFAKSVGWGWFGYHAYIAGTRLAGFVPHVLGLRNGLLFMEWVDAAGRNGEVVAGDGHLKTLSSYVARRVQRLRLQEDPCFANPDSRWAGWHEIMQLLRGAYGPYLGRLKSPALRRQLTRYVSPMPTLIDGRMHPEEWIETHTGVYKVDFEHHNFGGAEMNLVDPAYDLASTIFEFRLSAQSEKEFLEAYAQESGDRTILDRLLLYKLLYGVLVMQAAVYRVTHVTPGPEQEAWHQRYVRARSFLTCHTNRFCAGLIAKPEQAQWSNRLFFLDLDGVFDCEHFGFPHTTLSGLAALALLQSHGFSVVLNTGRSVEHVRNYCRTYSLPGGLAEFGSVLVDAVREHELGLIDAEAAEQLVRCREAMKKLPGVFLDHEYRYSIRAYRYNGRRTAGLHTGEVDDLLARSQLNGLACISKPDDTYIVSKRIGKGVGLLSVKKYLECTEEPVVAIGDSEQDVTMLEAAEIAYTLANHSKAIRELVDKGKCRVMSQPFQKGLLAAVREVLHNGSTVCNACPLEPTRIKVSSDLIQVLLQVAERPRPWQYLAALNWRDL